jgi:hypothetical protein
MNQRHLNGVLALFVGTYAAILIVAGLKDDLGGLRFFSLAAGVVGLSLSIFDRWLWNLPILHPWFVPTPDISGTWRGELSSSWDGEVGRTRRECYLVIRQTFSRVGAVLLTAESESKDLAAAIYRDNADGQTLAVTYQNAPRLQFRDGSPIHHGGMILHIRGNPPNRLDGEYFTSRKTIGEIEFTARTKSTADTFEKAASRFSD